MKLHPYQEKWVTEIVEAVTAKKSPLAVGATGSGKTLVGALATQKIGGRVLWVAHSRELLKQAASTFESLGEEVSFICGGDRADDELHLGELPGARVTLASIQSLHVKALWPRLKKMRGASKLSVLVIDEAHRARTESYERVARAVRCPVVGLTATPMRSDGRPLSTLFDSLCCAPPMSQLIDGGYIARPRLWVPKDDAAELRKSVLKCRESNGDFNERELQRVMSIRAGDVVRHWKELGNGAPTVAFCVGIDDGQNLRKRFRRAGSTAELLTGKTPVEERARMLEDFADGKYQVLVNVAVLREGWDCPAAKCLVIARPTKSEVMYLQMCGRIARPNGVEPRIIDCGAASYFCGPPWIDREYTLDPQGRIRGTRVKRSTYWLATGEVSEVGEAEAELTEWLWAEAKELLTEDAIWEAAQQYHAKHSAWPSCENKHLVPGMPGEHWRAIDLALRLGCRGLPGGSSLAQLLAALGADNQASKGKLTEDAIWKAAKQYHTEHSKWPATKSKDPVPGMPGESWSSISTALCAGTRGLPGGSSLAQLLAALGADNRSSKGKLTEDAIWEAAQQYHAKHSAWPSNDGKHSVPGMPKETWKGITLALRLGCRGLPGGSSLAQLLAARGADNQASKGELTEDAIWKAAKQYHTEHSKWPAAESKHPVPGMPGESWNAIQSALYRGHRGLPGGSSLPKLRDKMLSGRRKAR